MEGPGCREDTRVEGRVGGRVERRVEESSNSPVVCLSSEASSLSHDRTDPHNDRFCRLRTCEITSSTRSSMFSIRAPNCMKKRREHTKKKLANN